MIFVNRSPEELGEQFDVVVANILANPLIEMASQIKTTLKPNATLILSGILEKQASQVENAYKAIGLSHIKTIQSGEWVSCLFTSS